MKKLLAFALTAAMLFTTAVQNVSFAAFSDVTSDNTYASAITTLSKLNVIAGYEDGTFKPDGDITRAEFSKIVVYVLGLQDQKTEPTEFTDVADHWAKYNIKALYDQGIIRGMGDGTFAPDANVTYEQALKMVVCTLGYETFATAAGGYPNGYISEAGTLKLTDKISGIKFEDPAPRGAIAQLVYNALEIDMKELDNTGKTVSADKNLLNDYLKVKKLKGIMAGVEDYTTNDCHGSLIKNQMQVVDYNDSSNYVTMYYNTYTSNITDIKQYLGQTITAYYKQKNSADEATLVAIDAETTNNTVYTISSKDIDSYDGINLKYYPEKSTSSKSLKINPADVSIRYNGKSLAKGDSIKLRNKNYTTSDGEFTTKTYSFADALSAWLNPDGDFSIYGEVVLTDRDSDNTIDDVQIEDYQTIVAYRSPTTSDYKITDKLITGRSLILNPDSTVYKYTILKDNKQIEVTSISADDVVLYAASLDNELYTVYVTKNSVTGTISSYNESDGTYGSVEISGTTYDLGSQCAAYIASKQSGKKIASGQSGTFYTDKYNSLVYGSITEEKENPYAYITTYYANDGDNTYAITAFNPKDATSSAKNYNLASKVTFVTAKASDSDSSVLEKSSSSIAASKVGDALKETAAYSNADIRDKQKDIYGSSNKYDINSDTYSYSQIVRLGTNSAGEVNKIITLAADSVTSNEDTGIVDRCKTLDKYQYTSNSFTQNRTTQFSINSSTLILYVPGNRTRDGFAKKTSASFNSTDYYYIEAYDIDASKYAGLVIYYGASGSVTTASKTTDYSIVAKTPSSLYDADTEETTEKLTVYSASNATRDWTTADNKEFNDCAVGDVTLFGYDQDTKATGLINCIKFSDIASVLDGEKLDGYKYNWAAEQTPSADNNQQSYTYDFRFKQANSSSDEIYYSSTLGNIPYSRATMFNVLQVLDDASKIYVSKCGLTTDGKYDSTASYEEISITSATKFIRLESDRKSFSPYAADTTTDLTFLDLKDAKNYNDACSKVLVCQKAGVARLIVIYG